MQEFYCKSITFNKAINMLKCMGMVDNICKGVVESSYKENIRADATRAGHIRQKRAEYILSDTYSKMSESTDKRRK